MRRALEIYGNCKVCKHGDRIHIERLLSSGVPRAEIVRLYSGDFTDRVLDGHHQNHMTVEVIEATPELKELPEDLTKWVLLRAVESVQRLAETAKVTGSIKAEQALLQGCKTLLEFQRNHVQTVEVTESPKVELNFFELDRKALEARDTISIDVYEADPNIPDPIYKDPVRQFP